ncbi:MAG: SpoIIE family protein phosphatase [Spirochaetes bacterium]|nr:SpoIIE family protein phosphatase [Spirochaetota bacterium]
MALKLKKDDLINDEYRIKGTLGEGGMSVVYRAEDLKHKRDVALKFLKEGVTSSYVEDVIRFKREAEAVSKLDHPNVIKLFEVGEYENTPFLIEELLDGKSLSELLKQGKHFNIKETVQIIFQITEALDYVHKRGIIHRDLKPGNIVVSSGNKKGNKNKVTLLDFGIAHIMELSRIKEETEIIGTFGYMSPEATGIVSKQIDERSDFYSLGVVFYQLLAGELPFKSKELNKLLHEQVAVEPPRLGQVNKEIPKILEGIVAKLLYKESELRYQSAKGLLFDLERFLKGKLDFIIAEKDQKTKLTYQTTIVGRDEELARIEDLFRKAKDGQGSICLLSGAPGIGKSRLLEEVRRYVYEDGGLFIGGRCLDQQNKMPYQPFRDALNGYIRDVEKMDKKDRRDEVKRIEKVLGVLGEIIIQLNGNMKKLLVKVPELVSLDPDRENQRFIMVVSKFICSLSRPDKVCVLYIDDLQWADEGSLRLLEEAVGAMGKSNLLLLGTYRDNEVGDRHSLNRMIDLSRKKKYSIEQISLDPLVFNRLNKMIAGVLGEKETHAAELSRYVLEKSGGNPFFAISILRELVEDKGLNWKEGYWEPDWEKIRKIPVSANMIDIILRRIEDLTEAQVEILYLSSVIGREFEIDLLYPLVEMDKEDVVKLVDEAISMQLIQESIEKGKKIFVHDKIRDAFYHKIVSKKRKDLHFKIAMAIEEMNRNNIDEVIFDLAHHYTQAGDRVKSLEYVIPSAEKAKSNYANDEAVMYYNTGIRLLEEKKDKGAEWIDLKEGLADVCLITGKSDDTIRICEELLPRKESHIEKAVLYRKIGIAFFKKGNFEKCEQKLGYGLGLLGEKIPIKKYEVYITIIIQLVIRFIINPVIKLFRKRGKRKNKPKDREIIWLFLTLNWMYMLSNIEKVICNILMMLNIAEIRIDKSRELGISIGGYAALLMAIPLFGPAIKNHIKGLKFRKELKDDWGVAQSLQWLGYCYQWQGKYKQSFEYFEKAKDIFQKIGDMWELGMVINGFGYHYRYVGDYNQAINTMSQYLDISEKNLDNYGIASAKNTMGFCYVGLDDLTTSEKLSKDVLIFSKRNKLWIENCAANIHLGYLETRRKNYKKAIQYLENARKLDKDNEFLKEYSVYCYPYLADAYIEEYKENSEKYKVKDKKRMIRLIKRTCKEALKQTKPWINHYGLALRETAKYYSLIQQRAKAHQYFNRSIQLTKTIGRKFERAIGLYEYGIFLSLTGKKEIAFEKWKEAYDLFSQLGSEYYIEKCREVLGKDIVKKREEEESSVTSQDRLKTERRMNTVLDTSRYLSSILDLDELLDKIMNSTIELVGAERGALLLYPDEDENKPHKLEIKVMRDVKEETGTDTFQVSEKILKNIEKEMRPLVISDAVVDQDYKTRASVLQSGLKSVLCSPIMIKGELLGIIYLDSRLVSSLFTEDDLQVLELLASQSAVSIQNARLYKKSIVKERMERDMQIGGEIQKYFLPRKIEDIKNLSINTFYLPAEFIGGDYFDVVKMGKDKYGIIIVDISGHGSSAAIVMSVISFIFHSMIEKIKSPAQFMDVLSLRLLKRLKAEKYATGIFLIYDAKTGSFEYTNAGHNAPLLYNKKTGRVHELEGGKGVPIGVFEDAKFRNGKHKMNKGDVLLLQTDGVYETMNEKKQQFDLERVKNMLLANAGNTPETINSHIIAEVSSFRGNRSQADDITIITMKKTG